MTKVRGRLEWQHDTQRVACLFTFVYMQDYRVAAERMRPFEDADHLC